MNTDNIRQLIEVLSEPENRHKFNMNHREVDLGCGTVMCLGGWCNALEGISLNDNSTYADDAFEAAKDFLGLTQEQVDNLFYPNCVYLQVTNPTIAIRVLEHLIETSEVCWKIIPKDEIFVFE